MTHPARILTAEEQKRLRLEGNKCENCAGQLQHNAARSDKAACFECGWCGAAGDYATACTSSGAKRRARIHRVDGDLAMNKPWVSAHSLPYAQRVRG